MLHQLSLYENTCVFALKAKSYYHRCRSKVQSVYYRPDITTRCAHDKMQLVYFIWHWKCMKGFVGAILGWKESSILCTNRWHIWKSCSLRWRLLLEAGKTGNAAVTFAFSSQLVRQWRILWNDG